MPFILDATRSRSQTPEERKASQASPAVSKSGSVSLPSSQSMNVLKETEKDKRGRRKSYHFLTREEQLLLERKYSFGPLKNALSEDDQFERILKDSRSESGNEGSRKTSRQHSRLSIGHSISLYRPSSGSVYTYYPRIHYRYKKKRYGVDEHQCIFVQLQGIIVNISANLTQIIKVRKAKKAPHSSRFDYHRSIRLSRKSTVSFIDQQVKAEKPRRKGSRRKSMADVFDEYNQDESDAEDLVSQSAAHRHSLHDQANMLDTLPDITRDETQTHEVEIGLEEEKRSNRLWDDLKKAGFGEVHKIDKKKSLFELILNPDSFHRSPQSVLSKRKSRINTDNILDTLEETHSSDEDLTVTTQEPPGSKSGARSIKPIAPKDVTPYSGKNITQTLQKGQTMPPKKTKTTASPLKIKRSPDKNPKSDDDKLSRASQEKEKKAPQISLTKRTRWGASSLRPKLRFKLPGRNSAITSEGSLTSLAQSSSGHSFIEMPAITRAPSKDTRESSPKSRSPSASKIPQKTQPVTTVGKRGSDPSLSSPKVSNADKRGVTANGRPDSNQKINVKLTKNSDQNQKIDVKPSVSNQKIEVEGGIERQSEDIPKENGEVELEEFLSVTEFSSMEELEEYCFQDMNEMDDTEWRRLRNMKNNNYKPSSPSSWTQLKLLQYELWRARLQVRRLRRENEYLKKESSYLKMIKLVSGTELIPETFPLVQDCERLCSNLVCSLLAVIIGVILGKCLFS